MLHLAENGMGKYTPFSYQVVKNDRLPKIVP